MLLYYIVQILIALILVIFMGLLAFSTFNKNVHENIVSAITYKNVRNNKVKIIDGFYAFSKEHIAIFNTTNNGSYNYVDISPSVNQDAGHVYTYNFWIFIPPINNSPSDEFEIIPLFIKGSKEKVNYIKGYATTFSSNSNGNGKHFLIKNPLINLKRKKNNNTIYEISIELNAQNHPDLIKNNPAESHLEGINFIGIKNLDQRKDLMNKWNMFTFVVSETNSESLLQNNQANIKLYLNGHQYLNSFLDSAKKPISGLNNSIKRNYGNFYINPDKKDKVILSDITFFNYLISEKDIVDIFNKGCKKTLAFIPTAGKSVNYTEHEASLESHNEVIEQI